MPAALVGLTIPAYADFRVVFDIVGGPTSLAGYSGKMQIRSSQASTTTLADYSTEITVDSAAATVSIVVLAAVTQNYTFLTGYYDLVITGPQGTYRVAQGAITVSPAVTRS